MARNYYITKSGRLYRKDNTAYFEVIDAQKIETEQITTEQIEKTVKIPLPVADIDALYLYGAIEFNTALLNFLAQQHIAVHIFDYFGNYSGSYYPKEYLNSGFLVVRQTLFYKSKKKRIFIAQEFIRAAAHAMQKNIAYYSNRGKELLEYSEQITKLTERIDTTEKVSQLMGIEGNIREAYYKAFAKIIDSNFDFEKRVKNPPDNPVNALISFGNSMCYSACLNEIYRTQLNPLISFLHEPGERRFSLALDISEIFKPMLVDRVIFKLINQKMIQLNDFEKDVNYCMLNEKGRRIFIQEWDAKIKTTIQHRRLNRKVSYRQLIRLECYKLIKHLTNMEEYRGFRAWW